MSSRTCPHPSCSTGIDSDRFACARHWRTLPGTIKRGINLAWRALLNGEGTGEQLEEQQHRAIEWWPK